MWFHEEIELRSYSIQQIETVQWEEVDQLSGEDRGGGFGHSGR